MVDKYYCARVLVAHSCPATLRRRTSSRYVDHSPYGILLRGKDQTFHVIDYVFSIHDPWHRHTRETTRKRLHAFINMFGSFGNRIKLGRFLHGVVDLRVDVLGRSHEPSFATVPPPNHGTHSGHHQTMHARHRWGCTRAASAANTTHRISETHQG